MASLLGRLIGDSNVPPASSPASNVTANNAKLKVCVVGVGISGTQAMKAALREGFEVTAFESGAAPGGFWRFKSDPAEGPSVYRSTHVDTSRCLNSCTFFY